MFNIIKRMIQCLLRLSIPQAHNFNLLFPKNAHTHTFWCQLICIAFGSVIPFKQMKPIGNPIEWPRKKNRVEELSIHFHWIETQLKL